MLRVTKFFAGLGYIANFLAFTACKDDEPLAVNIAVKAVSLVMVTVLGFSVFPSFQPVNS